MCRTVAGFVLAFLLVSALGAAEESPPGQPSEVPAKDGEPGVGFEEQKPYWHKVTVPNSPPTERALAYPLRLDPLDSDPGNAALLWLRAGMQVSQVKRVITEDEEKWSGLPAHGATPLDQLPQEKVAKLLEPFESALRIAHAAARRERCDWGEPPLTLTNLHGFLPLDEIQSMRTLARLLCFEHRLALAKGDWKESVRIVRTGLTMARHLGESKLLLAHLVGIAIEAIMQGRIEEMIVQPGAPNLYWSLTDLPTPLVAVETAIRYELNTVHRTFPSLRRLEATPEVPLDQEQLFAMFSEALRGFQPEEEMPAWKRSLLLTTTVAHYFQTAKKALLDRGVPREKVEKLPTAQVVGLYFLNDYNRLRDDVLKLQNLPPWQAQPLLDALEKQLGARMKRGGNPFLMLFPAINKVAHANLRQQRSVAILRTVEAIRLHAAHNGGKLPAKLADLTVAPAPIDPATGRTFEAYYRVEDGVAKLEVPPLSPYPAYMARHFEIRSPVQEKKP